MGTKLARLVLALAMLVILGCEGGQPAAPASPGQPAQVADSQPAPPPPPPPPSTEQVKAEGGVGKRGHGYGTGLVATPIATYFHVKDQIAFDQIQHTLNLYKAEHERWPRSTEEFMEKIIKANGFNLPELREGDRYLFDPKTGELLVERPKGSGPKD